jgi:DNA polymerase (family 10)
MPRKPLNNRRVADVLREIGLILQAQGIAFKPQAYEHAADTILALQEDLSSLYKMCGTRCIDDLPGIGPSITKKIKELVMTGRLAYYDNLKRDYPMDLLALTSIQNVGPKTAVRLYQALGIKTLKDLERAVKAKKIHRLPGFGRKTEDQMLRGLGFLREHKGRTLLHDALPLAEAVVERLRQVPGVTHCDVAGSLRRRRETIGDIDLLITTSKPKLAIQAYKTLPQVSQVLEEGPTYVVVRFSFGMNGDLRILKPGDYGSALVHYTGSREHNILIRERARKLGYKLSEYGFFRGNTRIACKTEADVYKKLKMQWIPPEIREATDEVSLAAAHKIPDLIGYDDLRGDLQVQTDWTDGAASIEAMAREAKARGLSYIAITDHTRALAMTGGLNEKRLREQGREIDRVNKKISGLRILKGTECDVLRDGSLDLSDKVLKTLDIVCISIHNTFQLSELEQTERLIRAMKNPLVNVVFHPTGRVVNRREPYAIDMPRVVRAAKEYHVALEVNGSDRLDLRDLHVRMAIEAGVKLVIDSDAHFIEEFGFLPFGIATARRGWAKKSDVLNTLPVASFLKAIGKNRPVLS